MANQDINGRVIDMDTQEKAQIILNKCLTVSSLIAHASIAYFAFIWFTPGLLWIGALFLCGQISSTLSTFRIEDPTTYGSHLLCDILFITPITILGMYVVKLMIGG